MKKICFVLLLLWCTPVFAEEAYDIPADFLVEPDFSFSEAVESLSSGEMIISADELWESVYSFALKEVRGSLSIMCSVFGSAIIFAVISSMENGFGKKGITQTAFFVVYMIITGILITSFKEVADLGSGLIESIVLFQNAAVPMLGAAIVSSGSIGVYSAMSPIILLMAGIASNIIKLIGMPAVYMSFSLSIVGNISERFSLKEISSLVRKAALWIISGVMTIFCAIVGISGMSSGAISGVAAKTLKFAAGSSIPVLGGVLSDSIEAVAAGAVILKNALGAAGIIFLVLMVLFPLLKIAAVILIYKLTGALMRPFADKRIVNVMDDMAGVLGCIIGFIAAVSVAFIISISLLVSSSNVGVMIR